MWAVLGALDCNRGWGEPTPSLRRSATSGDLAGIGVRLVDPDSYGFWMEGFEDGLIQDVDEFFCVEGLAQLGGELFRDGFGVQG